MTSSFGYGASGASPPAMHPEPQESAMPVPRPESHLVYSTSTIRVQHVGDAAFLTVRGWPLLRTTCEGVSVTFYFPLEAKNDLEHFRKAIDIMRAEVERAQQHRTPRTGEVSTYASRDRA